MEIILRNGEKVNLDWNPIVLEYLEEYEGGIAKLKEDVNNEDCRFYTFNFVIYSILMANYHEELTYRQAVSLVNINDYERIIDFIIANVNGAKTDNKIEVNSNKSHRR